MDRSLTSWMMSGGLRVETLDDRRLRTHRMAIRDDVDDARRRPSLRDTLARSFARTTTAPATLTTDCCVA